MNDNLNPYEVVKTRYESNVSSFILSDLFRPNLFKDEELTLHQIANINSNIYNYAIY